ncbi:MAG: tetratricopeptide repeat protein [Gammaproteobacteria bacterium]|nr:tetratricopeptide repeat protein [Gammaproteobacteria bacterium]
MQKKLIAFLATAFLAFSLVTPAHAQQEEEEETKNTFMSPGVYKRISRAYEDIEAGNYSEAVEELEDLISDIEDSPYEKAVALQTLGYVYINQEKWRQAAQYLQAAYDLDAFPPEPEKQVVYALAQIYSQLEEYDKTIRLMNLWFKGKAEKDVPPDAYIILANAYSAKNQFQQAYPWVRKAVQAAPKPKKDWLNLQLAVQFELGKFGEAAETLEILIANWPDEERYWQQLSGVQLELNRDAAALATLALAYEKDFLEKEDEYLNLARLYMLNEVPYKGAMVLDKALEEGNVEKTQKNYELLSQALIQAREYKEGIAALGEAAEFSDDGELYLRQAQLYTSIADWEGAMEAAKRAVEKGNMEPKKTGQAWLVRGTAAAEAKQFDAAVEAFNKARGYEDTRKQATQWLSFVRTEQSFSQR